MDHSFSGMTHLFTGISDRFSGISHPFPGIDADSSGMGADSRQIKYMNIEEIKEGLTFDDILLVPAYSEILPSETNVSTRFSRNISVNIPLCSSAMDTVTEANLAIALAQQGGIGV